MLHRGGSVGILGGVRVPKGKQLDNKTIYAIMTSYFITGNANDTARALNIPNTTVRNIVAKNKDKKEFVILGDKKKADFSDKASEIIDKGLILLNRRITTAIEKEEEIAELLEAIGSEDIPDKTKSALYNKIKSLEIQKLGEITTAIGTLYDKRALARGESTENTAIVVKFNDEMKEWAK